MAGPDAAGIILAFTKIIGKQFEPDSAVVRGDRHLASLDDLAPYFCRRVLLFKLAVVRAIYGGLDERKRVQHASDIP